ncbi:MAG: SCP2 sterol-binding domain-containing protein [Candidatus Thorarchaeota archaeon]
MISIQKGEDLLSISLNNVLSYRKDDDEFIKLVKDWNKKIVIELEDFYPVEVIFQGTEIKFESKEIDKKVDLKIFMSLNTLLNLAYGRLNPIKAVLKRQLKIKGILKVGTVIKFIKIFLRTMKMVTEDPAIKYYEKNKETR